MTRLNELTTEYVQLRTVAAKTLKQLSSLDSIKLDVLSNMLPKLKLKAKETKVEPDDSHLSALLISTYQENESQVESLRNKELKTADALIKAAEQISKLELENDYLSTLMTEEEFAQVFISDEDFVTLLTGLGALQDDMKSIMAKIGPLRNKEKLPQTMKTFSLKASKYIRERDKHG